jgi:PAS domain S-box-containing protein
MMVDYSPAAKPRILYVDDEVDNLQSFRALFRKEFDIRVTESAKEALDMLRREPIDVLVSDQRMPGMTGVELLERAAAEFPEVLRFMLTGFSDFDPLVDAINNGRIQGYFSKPLNPDEIKDRIQKGLENIYLKARNEQLFQELRQSQDFLHAIIENIPDMIYVKDIHKLQFIEFNRAGEKLLGYTREELLGKTDYDLFPKEEADSYTRNDREVLSSCRVLDIPEETIVTRHKGQRVLSTKKVPILDDTGQPQYLLGVSEDITEKVALKQKEKSLEAELRQLHKLQAIGTLAGGIAHDFNNVLGPILGYTEMVMMKLDRTSKNYENLSAVFNAAQRAKDLVRQILTFCRKTELEPKPLQLQPLIKETVKLLRSSLPSTIEILQVVDERCGAVMADSTQMQQVIMNLCTNAYHSMRDRGGVLELTLKQVLVSSADSDRYPGMEAGGYVHLSIRDTGCGMTEEVIERIFEPYFTTKEQGEGTGLGLSVVHGIVTGYGGCIRVSSEIEKGSVFNVYLPLIESSPLLEKSRILSPPPGGRESILLVDDEQQMVNMMQQMLRQLGYSVTSFTDSLEAFEYFKTHSTDFDLIISDVTMPKITGPALARKLLELNENVKILISTGLGERIPQEKAGNMGIKGMIMKPVNMRDLAAAVRSVLDGKSLDGVTVS